ncbi:30S ribosomal protein S13 [Candidatus Woesearchaeota archaeon]|nr:30S ribosomal protein S13 [Candidatus Woesearchaeota archaeon]
MEKTEQKQDKDFKYFVRVATTDLDGNKKIVRALTKIKGVGFRFSNIICSFADIDKDKKTGYLSDEEVKRMDEVIKDPLKFDVPVWMMNRRKDFDDGKDKHLITADLIFSKENDIKIMKKIKNYKGMRHAVGLTVRGQKTKSNFRRNKGKGSLGVKKKAGAKAGRS